VLDARPFVALPTPWEQAHPAAAAWLDALSDAELAALESAQGWPHAPDPLRTWAREASELAALPALPGEPVRLQTRATRRMPGRKVRQVEAFVGVAWSELRDHAGPLVDWCAGKAHMGRALAGQLGCALVAVERDADLCAQGEHAARAAHLPAEFVVADALAPATWARLSAGAGVVALHACGALHTTLVRETRTTRVVLAPCCYDKALDASGQAELVSRAARAALPPLDVEALRLIHEAPSETGEGELGRVRQMQAWRLSLDRWLRDARGAATYTSLPACPASWRAMGFEAFCGALLARGGLPEPRPGEPSLAPFEALGWQALGRVRRRDVVRGLLRRPIEVALALDRAAGLAERGYAVQVGTFCAAACTPRNVMITARAG